MLTQENNTRPLSILVHAQMGEPPILVQCPVSVRHCPWADNTDMVREEMSEDDAV